MPKKVTSAGVTTSETRMTTRTALMVCVSKIPSFAEPFFLNFNADCRFRPVMLPDDLGKAGLEDLGKKWR